MATTSLYEGGLHSIPDSASPGLRFLKYLLPVLDSLNPEGEALALTAVMAPGATFTVNNNPPSTTEQVLPLLLVRAQRLASFGHELHRTWDVAKPGGGRTVMYESTSTTIMSEDPELQPIAVREFNVVELVAVGQGEGGFAGFKAAGLRTYMDAGPIRMRAATLHAQAQAPQV
ncbi:hypothetical protein RB601_005644 [Gaeumannomyces tritici]